MTLIETIAVLVILGAVATAGLGMIGPVSAASSRREALAIVETFIDRARLLAEQRGGAVVTAGKALTAVPVSDGIGVVPSSDTLVITRTMPAGWSCEIRTDRASPAIDTLLIAANGISADCMLVASNQRGDSITLQRLGISGQTRIVRDNLGMLDMGGTTP